MESEPSIYTIGHSTHPADVFWGMLQTHGINTLADIRRYPGSRRYPHFAKDALTALAPAYGMQYSWLPALGGRRKAEPTSQNTAWRNQQFRAYADYMETGEFQVAIGELCLLALERATAIMCSEAVWWRCHRGLVADYLKVRGWRVVHIFSPTKTEEHPFTSAAKVVEGKLTYR